MQIKNTELLRPEAYWQVLLNNEEIDKKQCKICHTHFSIGEIVYLCEYCKGKTIFHRKCIENFRDPDAFICKHRLEEYQFFCGAIIEE
jgi:hypothetical protein